MSEVPLYPLNAELDDLNRCRTPSFVEAAWTSCLVWVVWDGGGGYGCGKISGCSHPGVRGAHNLDGIRGPSPAERYNGYNAPRASGYGPSVTSIDSGTPLP